MNRGGEPAKIALGLLKLTVPSRALSYLAVRALTAAAALSAPATAAGDLESPYQDDWADFVARAMASAAANVGGIGPALAGRPGSWEAAHLRNLLEGAVGADEEFLWGYRTEPIDVTLFMENIVAEYAPAAEEQYELAQAELEQRYDALGIPTVSSAEPDWQGRAAALLPETPEQQAAGEQIDALLNQLEEQRVREWQTYGDDLKQRIEQRFAALLPDSAWLQRRMGKSRLAPHRGGCSSR